jgi:hypothetical protein
LCRIESCCFDASDRFLWSDTDSLLNNDSAIAMHCMSNIVTDVCKLLQMLYIFTEKFFIMHHTCNF